MRIHTNVSENVVRNAAAKAGVIFTSFGIHSSRKAKYGYEVILAGDSKRRQNNNSGEYAATWDQWGVFLNEIFQNDPNADCWAYQNASDFKYKTNYRFSFNGPKDSHGDHKWIIGEPFVQKCAKCTAVKRWN